MNKIKERREEDKKYIIKRLSTIEGQVRGIKKMVEEDRYCDDILIQISAINNSLKTLATEILKNHLETCVTEEIKKDNKKIIEELIHLIRRIN